MLPVAESLRYSSGLILMICFRGKDVKILAVIPARAGSKGIPNKNIRIINGKPLIAYAIENAINSKMISDIIITTDSPEIELIAKYYGVAYKHRRSELCGDSVTLDAVIYDACKDYDKDYVVTLQPTSPTLEVGTLDKAIQFTIDQQLDTTIAVVNRPHLAWVEKEGKVVPDYSKRLNRQYMPKRFLEAGAFVISKSEIVTESTRIGERVDVFEISEKEAIDVDSFQDLLSVEQVLKERRTAMIVNGNNQIGMGHVYRMLELADTLYYRPDIYFDKNITDIGVFGNTTYQLKAYENIQELLDMLSKGGYETVINDILDTNEQYIENLRNIRYGMKIVNFEDLGKGRRKADLVINALYQEAIDSSNIFCGEKYYLAPKMFLMYRPIEIHNKVKNVFVCFGGADPQNYTDKILNIIRDEKFNDIQFTVVLGKAKQDYKDIIENNSKDNIKILYDVSNMPELMSQCDIAITSRGRTCYELALLGIPTIAMAQNEREERHVFVCRENGFKYLGKDVAEEQIKRAFEEVLYSSYSERQEAQERMLVHDLRKGRERIKNLLDSL